MNEGPPGTSPHGGSSALPGAGWYADPEREGWIRYWNGTEWTDDRARREPPPDAQTAVPPAGWYADPLDPGWIRFWDGATWTSRRRETPAMAPGPAAPAWPMPADPEATQPVPAPPPDPGKTQPVPAPPADPGPSAPGPSAPGPRSARQPGDNAPTIKLPVPPSRTSAARGHNPWADPELADLPADGTGHAPARANPWAAQDDDVPDDPGPARPAADDLPAAAQDPSAAPATERIPAPGRTPAPQPSPPPAPAPSSGAPTEAIPAGDPGRAAPAQRTPDARRVLRGSDQPAAADGATASGRPAHDADGATTPAKADDSAETVALTTTAADPAAERPGEPTSTQPDPSAETVALTTTAAEGGTTTPDGALPPADWYPDPEDRRRIRYWDGQDWTGHIRPLPPPPGVEAPDASGTGGTGGTGPGDTSEAPATRPATLTSDDAASAGAGTQHGNARSDTGSPGDARAHEPGGTAEASAAAAGAATGTAVATRTEEKDEVHTERARPRTSLGADFFTASRLLVALLAVTAVGFLIRAVRSMYAALLLGQLAEDPNADVGGPIAALDMFSNVFLTLHFLVGLGTMVAWLSWQFRLATSARVPVATLRHSPEWHVGGWFIPFAQLLWPVQDVSDLHHAVTDAAPTEADAVRAVDVTPAPRIPAFIATWWAASVLGLVTFLIALFRLNGATAAADRSSAFFLDLGASLVTALGAALAGLVVHRITTAARH